MDKLLINRRWLLTGMAAGSVAPLLSACGSSVAVAAMSGSGGTGTNSRPFHRCCGTTCLVAQSAQSDRWALSQSSVARARGYMDGAVRSDQRAAQEVLTAMAVA